MSGEAVEITTEDGVAEAKVFRPEGTGPWPAVLFFMDGIGVRPALEEMAARLAKEGFLVLLPNLYYRAGAHAPFDPKTAFAVPAERERVMALVRAVDGAPAMRDTKAFLAFLDAHPDVVKRRIGAVGYCLGGRLAFMAAGTYPERFAAAASIHGGRLVADDPAAPIHLAPRMKAKLYAAVAQDDIGAVPDLIPRLDQALRAAGVAFELEPYQARHGFAVTDTPVYDHEAAEHHWTRIVALFRETLRA